mgnify:CR=1 FL=1
MLIVARRLMTSGVIGVNLDTSRLSSDWTLSFPRDIVLEVADDEDWCESEDASEARQTSPREMQNQ